MTTPKPKKLKFEDEVLDQLDPELAKVLHEAQDD